MASYRDTVLADGAVAYWRLGETSGTTAASEVGGYTGTISGGVLLNQPGALADGNPAMAFDGTDDAITIPNGAFSTFGTGPIAVEAWCRVTGTIPSGDLAQLFCTGNPYSLTGKVALFIDNQGTLYFRGADTINTFQVGCTVPAILDGNWHHAVGILRRATPTDTLEIWLDGTLGATFTPTATLILNPAEPDANIGIYYVYEFLAFPGVLDEVAIYHVALTPAQIANHYALRTASPGPDLVPVPDVVGLTEAAATASLNAAGFTNLSVTTAYHPTVAAGLILSQYPTAGSLADPAHVVALVTSLGVELKSVPNVVGQTEPAARASLNASGFTTITVTTATHPTIAAGLILSQTPAAGTLVDPAQTPVALVKSLGAGGGLQPGQPAYLQARGAIARGAAVRGNAYIPQPIVAAALPGPDAWTNISLYVHVQSLTIRKVLNDSQDTAHFTLIPGCPHVLAPGMPMYISLGSAENRIFGGYVQRVDTRWSAGVREPWLEVECVDAMTVLDYRLVTTEYASTPGAQVIRDLLAHFAPPNVFTARGVMDTLPTVSLPITNQRLSTVFRTITANLAAGGFYVDPFLDVHAWPGAAETYHQPTAPQPLVWDLWSLKSLNLSSSAAQLRTRIHAEGRRTTSLLGVPAAISAPFQSLPVDDSSMFPYNEAEAQLVLARIGTQGVGYQITNPPMDPALNKPGSVVTQPAAPGATDLWVADLTPFRQGGGWVKVGDQIVNYSGWWDEGTPPAGRLTLPATGYGSLAAPIPIDATVTLLPYLYGIWPRYGIDRYHYQPAGTAVVTVLEQDGGVSAWAATTRTDGIVEHLIQDGRLSIDGMATRAAAELADFAAPTIDVVWQTEDLNADVGRPQQVNMSWPVEGGATITKTGTVTIMEVEISFPLYKHLPRRTCRGATAKTAQLLDIMLADER